MFLKTTEPSWTNALITLLGAVGMLVGGLGWLDIVRKQPQEGFPIYGMIGLILFFSGSMTTNAVHEIGSLLDEARAARKARERKDELASK